ncbi:MAG: class I SAM-dependent methyltransferase [Trebonia sp.]
MTTLPPQFSASESHQARQIAESFGTDAERYDRSRPSYPQAMVDAIVTASPGRDVLDVGVGTGISARGFEAAGCRVLGVEPDARMAEFARRSGLEVEIAKFEEWDPAGRSFDAVIAGQAWHWVDPVAGAAKTAQVLRPAGRLAVFWNNFLFPPEVAEAFAGVYGRVLPDSPAFRGEASGVEAYSAFFAKTTEGIRQAGRFAAPEQWRFDWECSYTRDQWIDAVPTAGGFNLLPAEKLEGLLDGIGEVIDSVGGSFTMGYAAVVITAARAA